MVMFSLLALSASAQDLSFHSFGLFLPDGEGTCWLAARINAPSPVIQDFYVDFFVNRPAPPALGEWGDWWFRIDPWATRVWYMDGRELPEDPIYANHFELEGVGEVRLLGFRDGVYWYNVYPVVPAQDGPRWFDVLSLIHI